MASPADSQAGGSKATGGDYVKRKASTESERHRKAVQGHRTETRVLSAYLAESVDEADRWPIIRCVRTDEMERLQTLLDHFPDHVNDIDWRGMTALHHAAAVGNLLAMKMLLKVEGIDIELKDRAGSTPLHHTAVLDQRKPTKMLLDAGASVAAKKKNGRTPLHEAAWINHLEIVRELLAAGASPHELEANHMTPAQLARHHHADAAAKIIEDFIEQDETRKYHAELDRRDGEWMKLLGKATTRRRDCGKTLSAAQQQRLKDEAAGKVKPRRSKSKSSGSAAESDSKAQAAGAGAGAGVDGPESATAGRAAAAVPVLPDRASVCSLAMSDEELSSRGLVRGKFVCKCPYCSAYRRGLPNEWQLRKMADLGKTAPSVT